MPLFRAIYALYSLQVPKLENTYRHFPLIVPWTCRHKIQNPINLEAKKWKLIAHINSHQGHNYLHDYCLGLLFVIRNQNKLGKVKMLYVSSLWLKIKNIVFLLCWVEGSLKLRKNCHFSGNLCSLLWCAHVRYSMFPTKYVENHLTKRSVC